MTEQPEWLSRYPEAAFPRETGMEATDGGLVGFVASPDDCLINAQAIEIQDLRERIARLEAGQRELEARLGDDGK